MDTSKVSQNSSSSKSFVQESTQQIINTSGKKENKNKPRYQGRFVKESFGDKN